MENLAQIFYNIKATKEAIDFLYNNWDPVSYTDFTGYVVDIGVIIPNSCKKKHFCLAISWDNCLRIFPFKRGRKKLTDSMLLKLIGILDMTNFIEPKFTDPFEDEEVEQVPINLDRLIMIEEPLLREVYI